MCHRPSRRTVINFNNLPCDIKNIIFKMNRVLDTPEYHEFSCTPLECELYGVDPFEEEVEDRRLWHKWNDTWRRTITIQYSTAKYF